MITQNELSDMQDEIDRLTAARDELADKMLVMVVRMENMDCLSSEDAETIERMARELKRMYQKILASSQMSGRDEFGLEWLPYPENKPDEFGLYLVTQHDRHYPVKTSIWEGNTWQLRDVIAFRKLPAPYQPKGVEDEKL